MRHFFLAIVAAAGLIVIPPDASAQTNGTEWTSADGAFSVMIPEGWRPIDRYLDATHPLVVGPSPEIARQEGRDLAVCAVEARAIDAALNQQQTNERINLMLAPFLEALHPLVVHASSSEIMAGVRVISVDIDQQGRIGVTRQMQRIFAIPTANGIMQYQVGCGASGSAYGSSDIAHMQTFFSSLTLSPEAPQ